MPCTRLPCLLLVLLLAGWGWPASAQIRSCAGPNGESIYTDRNCADIGATDRLPRAPGIANTPPPFRGGCARRLRELVSGLTAAIDTQDANRLALYYDWADMSTRNGYAVMTQLDGIVRRPLYAIKPVYPKQQPILASDGSVVDASTDGFYPQTTVQRTPPVALRLEQTFNSGNTPARTVFSLRKRQGCWWLKL